MNYYISDLHFGHKNVIRFDTRPFQSVDEMDEELIRLWNNKVSDTDDVYIVGDFSYRSGRQEQWYLKQLNGRKHLILGKYLDEDKNSIWRNKKENVYLLDCGSGFKSGRLACFCIETQERFYSDVEEKEV